jgi:hypothetical protein
MSEPSEYELAAWGNVLSFKLRPISAAGQKTASSVKDGVTKYVENHPQAKNVLEHGKRVIAKTSDKVALGAKKVSDVVPSELKDWSGEALSSLQTTLGKWSRAGLSPKRLVAIHKKRGNSVESLLDIRKLDLAAVENVGVKSASWYYPALAFASGAGASFVITGGELTTVASAGATAAPSGGVIAAALAGDFAVLNALSSRAVGHYALLYGYDPEEPAEKLFIMSIVNAGTAFSSGAKALAMRDISNLTQALVRGKTWKELSKSAFGKMADEFNKRFQSRITKAALGKALPFAGIIVGGVFNWATLERLTDVAQIVYRRRFLLEKYPDLANDDEVFDIYEPSNPGEEVADEEISLFDEIQEASKLSSE